MTYSPGSSGSSSIHTSSDANISNPASNQFLQYNSTTGKWTNHTLVPADIPGLADFVNNLIASNGSGTGGGTTGSAPGMPTSFVASSSSSTSITLSWAAPTSAGSSAVTGYTVNYTGGTAHAVSASTLTYTYTGLTAGTAYQFTVAATNAVGTGSTATTSYTISTSSGGTGVPTAPTNVQATVSGSTATLTWAAPSSTGGSAITGYIAARDGVDSNGSGAYTSPTLSASTLSLVFNNLVSGNTYHLTVAATNSSGTGPTGTATVTIGSTSGGGTGGGGGTTGGSSNSRLAAIAMPSRGWFSGGSGETIDGGNTAFGTWRGNAIDFTSTWMDAPDGAGWNASYVTQNVGNFVGLVDIAIGGPSTSNFDSALGGSMDSALSSLMTNIRTARTVNGVVRPTVIRPFHEYNNGHDGTNGYAWAVGTTANAQKLGQICNRWKNIMATTFPEALMSLGSNGQNANGAASGASQTIWNAASGALDIVGTDRYNAYPFVSDSSSWNAALNATSNGDPQGIGAWLSFASSNGAPVYLPEYANDYSQGGDVTYWTSTVLAYFQQHAGKGPGQIFGESWFNQSSGYSLDQFAIYGGGHQPNVANAYKAFFSAL